MQRTLSKYLSKSVLLNLAIALAGLIVSSKISIELSFSPVPITLQSFAILLIALLFDRTQGLIIILTYLLLGIIGIPVFAGDKSGLEVLIGPTGGFLIGFIVVIYLLSLIRGPLSHVSVFESFGLFLIGHLVISFCGLLVLYFHVGNRFLEYGLYPFLPGILFKSIIGALLISYINRKN
ncbi:MAG: biotin transporter BioY [Calditrichaeota bacterium]|nr:biotin transporter BioY [Calditrichota bacterium]